VDIARATGPLDLKEVFEVEPAREGKTKIWSGTHCSRTVSSRGRNASGRTNPSSACARGIEGVITAAPTNLRLEIMLPSEKHQVDFDLLRRHFAEVLGQSDSLTCRAERRKTNLDRPLRLGGRHLPIRPTVGLHRPNKDRDQRKTAEDSQCSAHEAIIAPSATFEPDHIDMTRINCI